MITVSDSEFRSKTDTEIATEKGCSRAWISNLRQLRGFKRFRKTKEQKLLEYLRKTNVIDIIKLCGDLGFYWIAKTKISKTFLQKFASKHALKIKFIDDDVFGYEKYGHGVTQYKRCKCNKCRVSKIIYYNCFKNNIVMETRIANYYGNNYYERYLADKSNNKKKFFEFIRNNYLTEKTKMQKQKDKLLDNLF